MSVNLAFADTIAASNHSTHSTFASGQEEESNRNNFNSMSNKTVETEHALMEKRYRYQHHYQQGSTGLVGTPDANTYASSMSSNSIKNNNNQDQQQHFASSSTSQASASDCGLNVQDLFSQLHEALALEPKYQPNLFLPQQSNVSLSLIKILFLFHIYRLNCELWHDTRRWSLDSINNCCLYDLLSKHFHNLKQMGSTCFSILAPFDSI